MFKFNSNRSKNDCYFPEVRWTKGTSLTFQVVIKLAIVLSKWLPNSHSISRQGTQETKQLFILTLQCCFLFFFHPECPEVYRAGTPWLLPTSGVCSAPASIYLTLHPAVSVQWRFAYSETEKAQEVRFWWWNLEGWPKVSENRDTHGQCECLLQVTRLYVK